MKDYELLFLLKKQMNYRERVLLLKQIIQCLLKKGGILTTVQYLGFQQVYYNKKVINSGEKGKFALLRMKTNGLILKEIEHLLKTNSNVSRYLITRT